MNKMKITIVMIIMVMCFINIIAPISMAKPTATPKESPTPASQSGGSSSTAVDISSIINEPYAGGEEAIGPIKNIGGTAIAIMQVVGVSIAIVMLIFVAIKYMTSSPNDRAEIKKHMVPYVVGAIIMFGIVGLLSIISNFIIDAAKQF